MKVSINLLIGSRKTKLIDSFKMVSIYPSSPGGEIGRHKGLKIPRRKLRAGSSPALGTISNSFGIIPILWIIIQLKWKKMKVMIM